MPGLGSEILENLSKYKILPCPPHLQPTLQPGTFLRHGEPGAQLCGLAAVETAVGGGLNTDGDLGPVVGSQLTPHCLPGAVTAARAGDLYDLPRLVQAPGLDLAVEEAPGGGRVVQPRVMGAGGRQRGREGGVRDEAGLQTQRGGAALAADQGA